MSLRTVEKRSAPFVIQIAPNVELTENFKFKTLKVSLKVSTDYVKDLLTYLAKFRIKVTKFN